MKVTRSERFEYDVFLSFEGSESEFFVRELYTKLKDKGLNVSVGERIYFAFEEVDPSPIEAIEKSSISIPIFSYGPRTGFLDQVAKIEECSRTRGQIVLPIFSFVEPSDVGIQRDDFRKLQEQGIVVQVIRNWKKALRKIGSLKGYRFDGYIELTEKIVSEVMKQLSKPEAPVDDNAMAKSGAMTLDRMEVLAKNECRMKVTWMKEWKDAIQSPFACPISTAERYEYDVFLSFEGSESEVFVGELYNELKDAGVSVSVGERIYFTSEVVDPSPIEAIEKSRISIPIFSRYYGLRMGFLNQVAKIEECRRNRGQTVLPIFSFIEPSEVHLQTSLSEEDFCQLQEEGIDLQVISNWKKALRNIGSLKGYRVDGRVYVSGFRELMEKIVLEVKKLLGKCEVPVDDNAMAKSGAMTLDRMEVLAKNECRMKVTWMKQWKDAIQSPFACPISTAERYEYDVFLSFEGSESEIFVGELYNELKDAGVSVSVGERIYFTSEVVDPSPIEAIEKSSISIPIFSRYYGLRMGFLNQVAKIEECRRNRGQTVLPIFSFIEPSEVHLQTSLSEEDFCQLQEEGIDLQVISNWKKALRNIGSLKGYRVDGRVYVSGFRELTEKIVSEVKKLLGKCEVPVDDNAMAKSGAMTLDRMEVLAKKEHRLGVTWMKKWKEEIWSSFFPCPISKEERFKYDIFLSFEGLESEIFVRELYSELKDKGLNVSVGETIYFASEVIDPSPIEAIEKSRISIPIFSRLYGLRMGFLNQVAKIKECRQDRGQIVLPIYFFEPSDVRIQTSLFKEDFNQLQEEGIDWQVINNWKKALRKIGSSKGYRVDGSIDLAEEIVSKVMELLKIDQIPVDVNALGTSSAKVLVRIEEKWRRVGTEAIQSSYPSSLISDTEGSDYEVFLSFGALSFASILYRKLVDAGIRVYWDPEDVQASKDVPQSLMEVIEKSKVSIPIFFPDYASNKSCLHQVAKILKCMRTRGQIVLPIFYKINPSDVPNLTGPLEEPFRQYQEEGVDLQVIDMWKEALREIGSLEGCTVSDTFKSENELVKEIVVQVKKLLKRMPVDYNLVGMSSVVALEKAYSPVGERSDIAHYDVVLSFDAQDKVENLVEGLSKRMDTFGIGIIALNGHSVNVNGTGKIFIPVLSKSYVSNFSCLEMLAHMVKCRRSSTTNHILPIFYAVESLPLSKDDEVVNQWKEALMEVANISGWSLPETFTTEEIHNLTESVCQMVLHKLKLNHLSMGDHLVGIDHHVERILELLNLEVNDVRVIAISGEDGVGKTTLAKIVYHQLSCSFDGCSFLTEIDERTRHNDGIKYLQAKMISDLLNREFEVVQSVGEEIDLIERRFRRMKVLIILDEVNDSSHFTALVGQLNRFGFGSRIIIVTKVPTIITLPHLKYDIMINWGSALDNAYRLFSKHAFRKDDPLPNYKSLSEDIVGLLSGFANPILTIELVGSLLYGQDVAEWENLLLILQRMKTDPLEHILRISYDRLDSKQQKIFLDISCLPSGIDRQIASCMWHDSLHSSALYDVEILILLSLVKVDASNAIWMHCLVRGFVKEIVHDMSQKMSRKARELNKMDKIRYFKLDRALPDGSKDGALLRQRDFMWQQCSGDSPPTLRSKCLKVLDLSWSKITEGWQGWKQLKVPQLRVLNISGCSDLMVTPVFSFCPYLEMLILEHCPRLVKIDPSIGKLQRLNTLRLRYCRELRVLPKEVGLMTDLKELLLDGTSLRELPVSIGHLKNLHFFTANNCLSLCHLPSSTFNLLPLTVVKLDNASITELPHSIGQNMKLQHLSLNGCHGITRLPSFVGEIESSLVELDVSETSISELPNSVINLKVLRVLKMEHCFIVEFPPHFGQLKKLEEIHASWCRNLKYLPDDIGGLDSLRILEIRESCISSLPQGIQDLAHLETLDCTSCNKLLNLQELPSSLTSLLVKSRELKKLPNFVNLKRLKEFILGSDEIVNTTALLDVSVAAKSFAKEDDSFYCLPQCSSLRTLGLCLPLIRSLPGFPNSLRTLSLSCRKLEHIPPLPSTLVVLSIQDCRLLRDIPSVVNLENLQELEILDCPEIKKIERLESLQALRVLTISSSGIVSLKGVQNLTSLYRLTLLDCGSLDDELPHLSTLEGVVVNIRS